MKPNTDRLFLVAVNERQAEQWRGDYPGVEVYVSQKLPEGTRGTIELKKNRKARRNDAKR